MCRFDSGGLVYHRHSEEAGGRGDFAARFYAAEAAKVLQVFFDAAALTARMRTPGGVPGDGRANRADTAVEDHNVSV